VASFAYLFPGLNPGGFEDSEAGWPRSLRCLAAEAWRRAEAGQVADEEIHACDAQWAEIYDRMTEHEEDESERRREIAARSERQSPGKNDEV
jgi:hypothetical protein